MDTKIEGINTFLKIKIKKAKFNKIKNCFNLNIGWIFLGNKHTHTGNGNGRGAQRTLCEWLLMFFLYKS